MATREGSAIRVRWGLAAMVVAWTVITVLSIFTVLRFSSAGPTADGSLGMDYEAFVAAGQLVAEGNAELLYEPDSDEFSAMADVGFVYPPWMAILMVPWTILPVGLGLALWTVLGVTAMVLGLRSAGALDTRLLVAALVALPGSLAMALGQSSFFLVAIVAFALAPLATRSSPRGWAIGFASWKPHLLGGFAVLAVADPRRWLRSLLTGVLTAVALLGISEVLLPGSVAAWIEFIASGVDLLASAILEASLPGGLALAIGAVGTWRLVVTALVGLAVLVGVVVLVRRSSAGVWEQVALATAAWMLFVPHVVVYDLLLLVVPLGALMATRFRRDVIVVGTVLAFASTVGPWLTILQLRTFDRAIDLTTIGLIAFGVVAASWVARDRPVLPDSPLRVPASAGDRR